MGGIQGGWLTAEGADNSDIYNINVFCNVTSFNVFFLCSVLYYIY